MTYFDFHCFSVSGAHPLARSWNLSNSFAFWGRSKWWTAFPRSRLCSTVLWSLWKMCSTFSLFTCYSSSSLPWWVCSSSMANSSSAMTPPGTMPMSASKFILHYLIYCETYFWLTLWLIIMTENYSAMMPLGIMLTGASKFILLFKCLTLPRHKLLWT